MIDKIKTDNLLTFTLIAVSDLIQNSGTATGTLRRLLYNTFNQNGLLNYNYDFITKNLFLSATLCAFYDGWADDAKPYLPPGGLRKPYHTYVLYITLRTVLWQWQTRISCEENPLHFSGFFVLEGLFFFVCFSFIFYKMKTLILLILTTW